MIAALMALLAVWVIGELLPEWRVFVWITLAVIVAARCYERCL